MKERQRWRSEEDSLLHSYVKRYGPREWNLVSQRMNKALDRDPKSCAERWKNYLKPGIKKGSLSEDEQRLVISLQAKYGNRWKKIAAQVPGTTAKRLSKWWEVYREKQDKIKDRKERIIADSANNTIEEGKYDHILETFAEKYMQKQKQLATSSSSCNLPTIAAMPSGLPPPPISFSMPSSSTPDFIHFAIPSASTATTCSFGATPTPCLPPWMSNRPNSAHGAGTEAFRHSSPLSKSSPSSSSSPSVTLSLSPSSSTPVMSGNTASASSSWMQDTARQSGENNVSGDSEAAKEKTRGNNSHAETQMPSMDPLSNLAASSHQAAADQGMIMQEISLFFKHCRELEERQQSWSIHKKETGWRLKRLEQQLEAEKARKRREKMEEIESKVRALREEETVYLDRLESDYREQLSRIHRDAEIKEARMMEMWTAKHVQLTKFFEQMVHRHDPHKSI
uniref:Asymmetric leaves 1 n=1 Tax=Pseudotsuga menziesii TaxID=3357 RepID=A0A8E4PVH1_PSEMZ|nr:asymmetric leaves 1 [Pseudotsuga menziesii]